MAITILSQPTKFEPVYNSLIYRVTSTNSGAQRFKYIYDVFINGVFITRVTNAPAPDGYGYFDVSKVLEAYVSSNSTGLLTWTANPARANANCYIEGLQVKFGEQYYVTGTETNPAVPGGDPSLSPPYTYPATSNTIYPFNGALTYMNRVGYSQSNYLMTGTGTPKFLTNAPRELTITRDQNFWLSFLRDGLLNDTGDRFRIYGISNGNYLYEWQVDYNLNYLSPGGRYITIPASYKLWQQIHASFVTGDTWSNLTDPDIDTFQICIYNQDLDTPASETFTIRFKDDVCRFTPKEIVFQNRFGCFESYVFQLVGTETLNVSKSFYSKALPISQLNYTAADRRETVINSESQYEYTALSNWITEEESVWLQELISSPIVFINDNGTLKPINILTDTYDIITKENKKLFNIKIKYRLTITNDSQRG